MDWFRSYLIMLIDIIEYAEYNNRKSAMKTLPCGVRATFIHIQMIFKIV